MELPGETFLFNLSLLGITFSAVSALVTLLRQAMGGKLSNFDVYLLTVYVSDGFVLAINALLPVLFAQSGLSLPWVLTTASGLAAAIIAGQLAGILKMRKVATKLKMSRGLKVNFTLNWLVVALLLANAAVPAIRSVFVFEAALTIFLATEMWIFVRRITTLLGDRPGHDWDLNRS